MANLRINVTLMGLLISGVSYGQTSERYKQIEALADSVCEFYDKQTRELHDDMVDTVDGKTIPFFSKPAFSKFIDEYFTLVNYQRQSFPEGNSAGLIIAENNTKLNLTLSRKINSSILSLGTAVNVKDQSGMLFSNDKPTSGTQINIGYSFLLPRQNIYYDPQGRPRNYQNRINVLDSIKTLYTIRNPMNYKVVEDKLKKSDSFIRSTLDSVKNLEGLIGRWARKIDSLKAIAPVDSVSLIEYVKKRNILEGTLQNFSEMLVKELDNNSKLKNELASMELTKPIDEAHADLEKSAQSAMIKKQIQNNAINSLWFQWLSGSASYKREVYDTYDSALSFDKRVNDKSFNVWTLTISSSSFY